MVGLSLTISPRMRSRVTPRGKSTVSYIKAWRRLGPWSLGTPKTRYCRPMKWDRRCKSSKQCSPCRLSRQWKALPSLVDQFWRAHYLIMRIKTSQRDSQQWPTPQVIIQSTVTWSQMRLTACPLMIWNGSPKPCSKKSIAVKLSNLLTPLVSEKRRLKPSLLRGKSGAINFSLIKNKSLKVSNSWTTIKTRLTKSMNSSALVDKPHKIKEMPLKPLLNRIKSSWASITRC